MTKLNPAHAHTLAKELTLKAMEQSMINIDSNSEKTAQNVMNFYKTIYNSIAISKNESAD